MIKIDGWICTDPDTLQFAKHYEKFSRFKEFDRVNYLETFKALYENLTYGKLNIIMPELFNTNMFIYMPINEKNYKYNDIKDIVSTYGYTLLDNYLLDGYCKEDSLHLIRECIFEQTNGLY